MPANQPEVARLWDNSDIPADELRKIPSLQKILEKYTISELQKDLGGDVGRVLIFPPPKAPADDDIDDASDDKVFFRKKKGGLRTGNVMGFIGSGSEHLEIRSRFDGSNNEPYLLQYLIEKSLRSLYVSNYQYSTYASHENQIHQLVNFVFPFYLDQAVRKGLLRQYVTNQYNDSNLRGPIDVARHIKFNIPFTGKISYRQRNYSADNYVIQLIRHTIEYLKPRYRNYWFNPNTQTHLKMIIEATPSYSIHDRSKLVQDNFNRPIGHGFYHEYRDLQEVCLLILTNRKSMFSSGRHRLTGILFDGSALWEEYLNSLLNPKGSENYWHPNNRTQTGKQKLLEGWGEIYPDFISIDSNNRLILDAKYKQPGGISGSDYKQILSYMYRFDSKTGLFLFPWDSSPETDEKGKQIIPKQEDTRYLLKGVNAATFKSTPSSANPNEVPEKSTEISVTKLGLKIATKCDKYPKFRKEMEKNESDFRKRLGDYQKPATPS